MLVEGVALQRGAGGGVVDGALVVVDEADEVLPVTLHPEQHVGHPVGVLEVVVERELVVEIVVDLPPARARRYSESNGPNYSEKKERDR